MSVREEAGLHAGEMTVKVAATEMTKEAVAAFAKEEYVGKTEVKINTGLSFVELYAGMFENGEHTNGIININEPWELKVAFGLCGPLKELICGYWCVTAHFESIGNAPEFDITVEPHIYFDCSKSHWCVRIPGPQLDVAHCGRPYKVGVTVAYKSHCHRPAGIIGYVELPMTEFFRA